MMERQAVTVFVRQNVAEFCQEIKAVEDAGWPEGSQDQLKAKARERGLWNFFLPEVRCGRRL